MTGQRASSTRSTTLPGGVWADEQGPNHAGAVPIQEQRVFAARAVQKADARPGGYVTTPSSSPARNLTATKPRLLLMVCLMSFGSLPSAVDPDHPTSEEAAAIREKAAVYQAIFDAH